MLTAAALHQVKFALGGLVVDAERMGRNLGMSRGLIVAEAVMMGLAPMSAGRTRTISSMRRAGSPTTPVSVSRTPCRSSPASPRISTRRRSRG
jgi:adenylosuccinate lyase